jgi:hypothetical protein
MFVSLNKLEINIPHFIKRFWKKNYLQEFHAS